MIQSETSREIKRRSRKNKGIKSTVISSKCVVLSSRFRYFDIMQQNKEYREKSC